jgi:hypothetical protein
VQSEIWRGDHVHGGGMGAARLFEIDPLIAKRSFQVKTATTELFGIQYSII